MGQGSAQGEVYRISGVRQLIRGTKRVLADAVPALSQAAPPLEWGASGALFSPGVSKGELSHELTAMLSLLESAIVAHAEPAEPQPQEAAGAAIAEAAEKSFGWVGGSLPAPSANGRYVVEFVDRAHVRVLAYLDPFGRVFSTDAPLEFPPAREPDMRFVRFGDEDERGVLRGSVQVRDDDGSMREVALFARRGRRYELSDTWYDFGEHAQGLSYADAAARCYLAFVHRPSLGAAEVPARGLDGIEALFDRLPALAALRRIATDIKRAQLDPALRPPALARALARWLKEAGLDEVAQAPGDALRLVRTERFADIFYLGLNEAGRSLPVAVVWKLQNALNRYLLVKEQLGERASVASIAEVLRCDGMLVQRMVAREAASASAPGGERPADGPEAAVSDVAADADGAAGGAATAEWDVRCGLALVIEQLRAPYRFEADFRCDVSAGVVALRLMVPGAAMMPTQRWSEADQAVVDTTVAQRSELARSFVEFLAIHFAHQAFSADARIRRVEVAAYVPFDRMTGSVTDALGSLPGARGGRGGQVPADDGDSSSQPLPRPRLFAAFAREGFLAALGEGGLTDPHALMELLGARAADAADASDAADPFRSIAILPSARLRNDAPECADGKLEPGLEPLLGARWMHDVRVSADAMRRRQAERLANRLARAGSVTEAIHVVMREQRRLTDPLASQACTRLMEALTEGAATPGDQNSVVDAYMGEDAPRAALGQARSLVQAGDVTGAAQVISDAAWEAEATGKYVDDAEVVHRNFDTYASRILYNLAKEGVLHDRAGFGDADAGRMVELVPDSLLRCHMEAVKLLERSFSGMDSALSHALRAVELAPTAPAARCLLARVYMLMGDMASATSALQEALRVATQPDDIAIAYYQLAYTCWKAGDAQTGAACYVKSIATAPVMATQAAMELQDLLGQEGVRLPGRDVLPGMLKSAGVPEAPTGEVLDVLLRGAKGAVAAGAFPVARSLLATRLHYEPDDALMGVLRSLAPVVR